MKAFPCRSIELEENRAGMDLRDYFAAKALMSMLSPVQELSEKTPEVAAEWSYRFADAMMKARE